MKSGCVIFLLLLAIPSLAISAEYRVVSQDETGITVEFTPGRPVITPMDAGGGVRLAGIRINGFMDERIEGRPQLPVQRYYFEVPARSGVRLQVVDIDISPIPDVMPEVWFGRESTASDHLEVLADPESAEGRDFAVIAALGTFRHRELALVDIYPVIWRPGTSELLYASKIVVRLSFPRIEPAGRIIRRRGPGDRFIINSGQIAAGETGRRIPSRQDLAPFAFSYSDKWIKLKVVSSGLYSISYSDLAGAGINPIDIDPATLRVFTAGPLQEPDEIDDGGSFKADYRLKEVAVRFEGEDNGSFIPGERIVFYAVGIDGWMNFLDPSADRMERYEHYYAKENVYWLTWGGTFPGQPERMQERAVSPGGSPDITVSSYEERIHRENDYFYDPHYTDDRWYWQLLNSGSSTFTDKVNLTSVADGTGILRTVGYGPYDSYDENNSRYFFNGIEVGSLKWTTPANYFFPETLQVDLSNVTIAENEFRAVQETTDKTYIMWYELYYRRDLAAAEGTLDFFTPGHSGSAGFSLTGFPAGEVYIIDATDYISPVILTGLQIGGGSVEYEDQLAGQPVHYVATAAGSLKKPVIEVTSLSQGELVSLRDEPAGPHMVIIYNSRFEDAARQLGDYRAYNLPGVADPTVKVIDIEDIYNNFSGGMKDPLAIRNYMKFLYDNFNGNDGPLIRYLLLVGNGIYDPKDILRTGIDFVPLYMKNYGREIVEDDDFFVRLDGRDESGREDPLVDVAIGRMTVLNAGEAQRWVDNIILYESSTDLGDWRNKVVLVADDEFSASTNCDYSFIFDTEHMTDSYEFFPDFVDIKKIYLHHYPFSGDLKPEATADLLDTWNEGALIVKYTGHGSPQQMADERVMQKSDVYSLRNGSRRPLFLSFSCSVGNIESPYQRSIGQELVVNQDGGAIAAITGTGGTLPVPNRELCFGIFRSMFTSEDSTGVEPLGVALMMAKPCCTSFGYGINNAQYILLGDPAMRLATASYKIEHEISLIDTMITGKRYVLQGSVMAGGSILDSFNGTAEIVVQESVEEAGGDTLPCYYYRILEYDLPGKEIFRGSVDIIAGSFTADFVIPIRCRVGEAARIRTYARGIGMDGVGAEDSLVILTNPSVPENEGAPNIHIYFSGQATKVKKGATLNVEISDPDGIAILGTDPQSSIFLEFDDSGYPIFVTDYFVYDHGSSSTGRVSYPLHSGFSPGPHSVIVRAFDNLGESATDTLLFDVVEEGLYTVSDVFNMPNPIVETTNFVFQLSSDADVTLRLYNVSGREIWQSSLRGEEGFNSIYWDGRDSAGDRPANGTYLYILDVSFMNSFNRTERVTGKAVLLR